MYFFNICVCDSVEFIHISAGGNVPKQQHIVSIGDETDVHFPLVCY